jgi:hypothetical protein
MQNLPITTAEGVGILCEFRYAQDVEERLSDHSFAPIPLPVWYWFIGKA